MSDDRLLKELGEVARQEAEAEKARLDERWDRLAAGTLTPGEDAELRALAATSAEAREAYEAFRPLGADFASRVVSAVAARRPEPSAPRLLPFRRPGGWLAAWVGAAAAVAAGLFFLVRSPVALVPLPVYTAELSGGTQLFRGEPGPAKGLPVFVPGSLLTIEARPQQPVTGPVEAHGFLGSLAGDAAIVPWQPEPRFAVAGGAVRLRGRLGEELRLPPGAWRIWIVVGRPGRLPPAGELAAELRAGRTRHAGWQAVSTDLRVADRASP